ncbi:unnamed protein product [Heterobilharzia americana]|nr:unnamed protein product [Heterobilharzia americana]
MGDIHVVSHFNEVSSPSINPSLHNSSFSPPNSPKHDFRDSMSENINDRTTQYVACSSLSRGIEKRTRFSISVLPSTSEVKGFGNTTLLSNRSFTAHSTVPETRHNNSEPVVHSSVVRCSSVDLSQSGLVNCVDLLTERTIKFEGQKSQFAFVSTIPVSNTLKYNDKKSSNKPRCSSLTSLCVSTGSSLLPAHRNSQRLMASTSNQDIEGQGTSSFSVDSASSHSDTDSGLIGAAISQPSTTSSSCHLNSSFMHSFQNSHDQVDVREVDEQSSLLTCSSCGVHLGEDVMPDPIPENSESQDVDNSNGQIGTQVDEQSTNISGRVTPLSLTSATSRGGPLTQSSFPSTENNYRGSRLTRCGPNDFPSTLFQRHCTSDVTEKFNKFDLPPARLTENETRSTVSDTWSTDVLPSDTEYADLGQEFSSSQANSNPDMVGRRLNSHNAPRVSHRHAHRHHHRRMPVSESIVNETAENNLRPPATAPELDNRGRHLNLQSDLLVDEAANDEEMQNGHNSVEVNNPNHSEVTLPSGTDSQYQDNFDLSSPVDSSSPNRKTSSIQPCSDSVSFAGITDCSTPSTSYTKIQTITIDKDKLRPFRPTDGRRNLNTNRFQGSAHTLKESFSRFMERLDIMTRRQRISANSGIEKQYETSRSSQYNDYQSNLYTLLPDLMESVPIEPGTNKKNHSSMNTSSSAALSWSSKTLSKFNELTTVNKEISDVLSSSSPVMDGAVKNEETVDEMMERYRRQTGITSMADSLSSHQLSNSFYCDEKQVPSTLEGTLNRNDNHKSGDCKSAMKKTSMASSASSSSSSSSSASFSSSYLQSHRSIPQLFNLALHGLQEIFSNSTLSIIALNTINKIRLTWKLIHNQPLSQQVNISSIFHENQILITLLSSMLAGLHDTQQNSTVYDVLMETKNIILELNKRLDIGENFGSVLEKVNHSTIPNDNLPENNSSNSKHHNNSQFNTTNGTSSCPLNKCLISSLRQYLRRRQVYRAHLIKSRQQLNQLKSNLELSVNWLQQSIRLLQQYVTKRNLSELIKQNKQLFTEFYEEFSSEQSYCDPKLRVELVRKLVARLIDKMKMKWRESSFNHSTVSTSIELQNNNNSIENVFTHLERLVMDEIYSSVIWINDSAVEEERDDLFHRELGLLQNTITPLELRIPEHYHVILPLQSVQNELRLLDCYHTPSDKLHCLKRVMNHILAALQLAHPTSVPCADDLLPVLIYLIIQANPPRLLSNIEFVNNLGSDNFEAGEIQYIWCQFCSAVAEIRHLMSIRPLNRNSR